MLPRKLHLEQINRFHDKVEEIDAEIQKIKGREDLKDHCYKLLTQYFELTNTVWSKIDDVCEFDIKNNIDIMES